MSDAGTTSTGVGAARPAFDEALLQENLARHGRVGQVWAEVRVLAEVGSTNAVAAADPRPWTVVCADHQSSGRGRLTRRWEAPPRASIAVSAVLPAEPLVRSGSAAAGAGGSAASGGYGVAKDDGPATQGWLPLLTGMAMAFAIRDVATTDGSLLEPRLKWPNDLLLEQHGDEPGWRKVGGVLCELVPGREDSQGGAPVVVCGVGVNVDQQPGELPVPTATSLVLSGAAPLRREELVAAYLARLAVLHGAWSRGGSDLAALRQEYRQLCQTLGRPVEVHRPDGAVAAGSAVAVDDLGRLVLDRDGVRSAYSAGDVVHLRATADGTAAPTDPGCEPADAGPATARSAATREAVG